MNPTARGRHPGHNAVHRAIHHATPPTVAVLSLPGCPHTELLVARLTRALDDVGYDVCLDLQTIGSAEAEQAGFRGSPTLLLDGVDPFPAPKQTSWACRLYGTEAGLEGSPSVSQLRAVLLARRSAVGEVPDAS